LSLALLAYAHDLLNVYGTLYKIGFQLFSLKNFSELLQISKSMELSKVQPTTQDQDPVRVGVWQHLSHNPVHVRERWRYWLHAKPEPPHDDWANYQSCWWCGVGIGHVGYLDIDDQDNGAVHYSSVNPKPAVFSILIDDCPILTIKAQEKQQQPVNYTLDNILKENSCGKTLIF